MAEKKKTSSQASRTGRGSGKKTKKTLGAAKKTPARAPRSSAAPAEEKKASPVSGLAAQLMPFIWAVAAVFTAVCLLTDGVGIVGEGLRSLLFGLFAGAAYTLPLYFALAAFMWHSDSERGMIPWKIVCFTVTFCLSDVMLHFFTGGAATLSPVQHYRAGLAHEGGGAVGGVLGELMMRGFGRSLSLVLLFALLFLFALLMFGITPRGLWVLIAYKIKMSRERARSYQESVLDGARTETERARQANVPAPSAEPVPAGNRQLPVTNKKKNFEVDVDIGEDEPQGSEQLPLPEPAELPEETGNADAAPGTQSAAQSGDGVIDEKIFEEVMRRTQQRLAQNGAVPANASSAQVQKELPLEPEDADAEDADELPWDEAILPERSADDVMDSDRIAGMADEELDLSRIFSQKNDDDLAGRLRNASAEQPPEESADGEDAEMEIELSVERRHLTEKLVPAAALQPSPAPAAAGTPPAAPAPPEYQFPPVELLTQGDPQRDENAADELRDNAARLVRTLEDFHVKTKIVDVCRGPTITRYELLPEPGTRIRSIANLVDDIALNLATAGVRIEAPIPGKAAVGIEVPNKNAETVHLRTLLENPRFGAAKSRITAALGEDVAGADVYLDVAKMPHLLIAGSTGTGKSVCINSLIVSLLYKARPDELKLIMVDPKKVELNIYNGIPHLYMPVVSDPKKAAGALSWAVSEMERRYSLIEEVGVRDLKAYNEITKNDPSYEFLPQFVIIIDELADLMMTAKNDVEDSICRIAQKARAAGMHLIIGTQRPSVDVITGLIKANFPSRISFRVSSQVDSRTIIDRAGAEALVGRGDMLYSPVGASKPIRVQGAYVSEEDVEKVVDFIKSNNGKAEYDRNAIEEVERNAASISSGKKGGSADASDGEPMDDDPMLRPAIELAVESGKISTSLIQRRLSLGYGRAAKLIDRMEQLGYVSAPDGQKPREVLITKEQFMEMVLRDTDS